MYGGRISLFVGIAAALSSAFLGTLVGVVSGFNGGIVDGILMRFTDLMLSVPTVPVLLIGAMIEISRSKGTAPSVLFKMYDPTATAPPRRGPGLARASKSSSSHVPQSE